MSTFNNSYDMKYDITNGKICEREHCSLRSHCHVDFGTSSKCKYCKKFKCEKEHNIAEYIGLPVHFKTLVYENRRFFTPENFKKYTEIYEFFLKNSSEQKFKIYMKSILSDVEENDYNIEIKIIIMIFMYKLFYLTNVKKIINIQTPSYIRFKKSIINKYLENINCNNEIFSYYMKNAFDINKL
jgi:hypothetical protein